MVPGRAHDPFVEKQEPAVVEPSSQPDPTPPRRRAGRPSVLTPPLGLPVFPTRQRRPAPEPPPPPDDQQDVPPRDTGPTGKRCTCGHARAAHEHYRRGTDCGICGAAGCAAYTREPARKRRWFRGS
jgi:hypothetical protein